MIVADFRFTATFRSYRLSLSYNFGNMGRKRPPRGGDMGGEAGMGGGMEGMEGGMMGDF